MDLFFVIPSLVLLVKLDVSTKRKECSKIVFPVLEKRERKFVMI